MEANIFSRVKYYFLLAIKKPYLILDFLYKKHLGVILLIPIKETWNLKPAKGLRIAKVNDVDDIYSFYKRMNRDSLDKEKIKNLLKTNAECFLVYLDDFPIGGAWIFRGKITLKNTSEKVMANEKLVYLNEDYLYKGYTILDSMYRGKGVYQALLSFMINYYDQETNYKYLFFTTGASNGPIINTAMGKNAKLIGVVEVINICGFKKRKVFYLDKKQKIWSNSRV